MRLLGALLGQVIAEQAGPDLFALVERVRRRTIALRHSDQDLTSSPTWSARSSPRRSRRSTSTRRSVARAFTLYFQLVNLAEERQRIRVLRTRARRADGKAIDDSVGEAVDRLARTRGRAGVAELLKRVEVHPVLTAHPDGGPSPHAADRPAPGPPPARPLDDPNTTPDEDADLRRRLREEISLLWHTGEVRSVAPAPLDEVRSELAVFDETLFIAVPRFQRAVDRALDGAIGRAGPGTGSTRPTPAGPGRGPCSRRRSCGSGRGSGRPRRAPGVTSDVTLHTARLQADHLLRGYEAVAQRLMMTVAARVATADLDRALDHALVRDAEELPETIRMLRRRFPDEPYRVASARSRSGSGGPARRSPARPPRAPARYADAAALDADLGVLQQALIDDGLGRVAWGELADLRWQVQTFGFHLSRWRSASTRPSTGRRSRRSTTGRGRTSRSPPA